MEEIRSFIAIELPEEIKLKLSQLERQLKSGKQPWVKWVDPNSIHLTLKFLGNVDVSKTADIVKAIEESVREVPKLLFEVRGLGVFPNVRRAQVAWVGLSGDIEHLAELQLDIEANLEPLGFAPESRSFTPHLTIARLGNDASAADRQAFGELITSTEFEGGSFQAEAVNLMRSQLTRQGAIYTRLNSVQLGVD